MTLIEEREAIEPRILSGKRPDLDTSRFEESGSEDEFLIASEGYPEDGENNNNRDFFSLPTLPTLGLNYLNNLNLSLNLSLNLRNSQLWRIYENTSFTKPGFLSNYLGKHSDELEHLNEHDITPDTRGYFTITSFLRRHGFPLYEDDYSEEAILERVRLKKLQQQARRHLQAENDLISEYDNETGKEHFFSNECENATLLDYTPWTNSEQEATANKVHEVEVDSKPQCESSIESSHQEVSGPQVLNPFFNRVEVSTWEKIKIGIITCTVLPVKIVLMALVLLIALMLSLIGMFGVTFEESQNRPLPRWRRWIRWTIANIVMRTFIFCSGFIWNIKETGKRATPEEAPIFVVGPHSSYFDAFAVILLGAPSVVAKLSTKDIPVFGRLVTFTQAVYVSRESKGSRRQTMEVLKQRAQDVYHGSGMPQIFIFPEGTCSNRSSLIKFKPGAFAPQVPVQPVLIKYPNRFDACTWTFDGPPVVRNIWYSLSQLFNKIEIEYLPVYVPNEEEKNDSALYADNVRKVMAKALNIPLSDYQFEDGTLLCAMRESSLLQKFRSIHRAKRSLGLAGSANEASALQYGSLDKDHMMDFFEFQKAFYQITSEDTTVPEVQAAFNCFKKDAEDEKVDIRPYLFLTCVLYEEKLLRKYEIQRMACQMYGLKCKEAANEEVKQLLEELFLVSESEGEKKPTQTEISPSNSQSNLSGHKIERILEFAKLFADEVTERLPKTYPPREERDKLPTRKMKSD